MSGNTCDLDAVLSNLNYCFSEEMWPKIRPATEDFKSFIDGVLAWFKKVGDWFKKAEMGLKIKREIYEKSLKGSVDAYNKNKANLGALEKKIDVDTDDTWLTEAGLKNYGVSIDSLKSIVPLISAGIDKVKANMGKLPSNGDADAMETFSASFEAAVKETYAQVKEKYPKEQQGLVDTDKLTIIKPTDEQKKTMFSGWYVQKGNQLLINNAYCTTFFTVAEAEQTVYNTISKNNKTNIDSLDEIYKKIIDAVKASAGTAPSTSETADKKKAEQLAIRKYSKLIRTAKALGKFCQEITSRLTTQLTLFDKHLSKCNAAIKDASKTTTEEKKEGTEMFSIRTEEEWEEKILARMDYILSDEGSLQYGKEDDEEYKGVGGFFKRIWDAICKFFRWIFRMDSDSETKSEKSREAQKKTLVKVIEDFKPVLEKHANLKTMTIDLTSDQEYLDTGKKKKNNEAIKRIGALIPAKSLESVANYHEKWSLTRNNVVAQIASFVENDVIKSLPSSLTQKVEKVKELEEKLTPLCKNILENVKNLIDAQKAPVLFITKDNQIAIEPNKEELTKLHKEWFTQTSITGENLLQLCEAEAKIVETISNKAKANAHDKSGEIVKFLDSINKAFSDEAQKNIDKEVLSLNKTCMTKIRTTAQKLIRILHVLRSARGKLDAFIEKNSRNCAQLAKLFANRAEKKDDASEQKQELTPEEKIEAIKEDKSSWGPGLSLQKASQYIDDLAFLEVDPQSVFEDTAQLYKNFVNVLNRATVQYPQTFDSAILPTINALCALGQESLSNQSLSSNILQRLKRDVKSLHYATISPYYASSHILRSTLEHGKSIVKDLSRLYRDGLKIIKDPSSNKQFKLSQKSLQARQLYNELKELYRDFSARTTSIESERFSSEFKLAPEAELYFDNCNTLFEFCNKTLSNLAPILNATETIVSKSKAELLSIVRNLPIFTEFTETTLSEEELRTLTRITCLVKSATELAISNLLTYEENCAHLAEEQMNFYDLFIRAAVQTTTQRKMSDADCYMYLYNRDKCDRILQIVRSLEDVEDSSLLPDDSTKSTELPPLEDGDSDLRVPTALELLPLLGDADILQPNKDAQKAADGGIQGDITDIGAGDNAVQEGEESYLPIKRESVYSFVSRVFDVDAFAVSPQCSYQPEDLSRSIREFETLLALYKLNGIMPGEEGFFDAAFRLITSLGNLVGRVLSNFKLIYRSFQGLKRTEIQSFTEKYHATVLRVMAQSYPEVATVQMPKPKGMDVTYLEATQRFLTVLKACDMVNRSKSFAATGKNIKNQLKDGSSASITVGTLFSQQYEVEQILNLYTQADKGFAGKASGLTAEFSKLFRSMDELNAVWKLVKDGGQYEYDVSSVYSNIQDCNDYLEEAVKIAKTRQKDNDLPLSKAELTSISEACLFMAKTVDTFGLSVQAFNRIEHNLVECVKTIARNKKLAVGNNY